MGSTTQLNVIFHGPCAFVIYHDHIEALLPDIDGHVYGVGEFMNEDSLPPGVYNLMGIPPQATSSNPSGIILPTHREAVFIGAGDLDAIDPQSQAYATLMLPLPISIAPLGSYFHCDGSIPCTDLQDLGKVLFKGDAASLAQDVLRLGITHYLKYSSPTLPVSFDPSLTDLRWVPSPQKGISNLHIFGTKIFELNQGHSLEAFSTLVQLLSGLSLGIKRVTTGMMDVQEVDGIPVGQQGSLRGHQPGSHHPLSRPPLICDAPSLFVTGAS